MRAALIALALACAACTPPADTQDPESAAEAEAGAAAPETPALSPEGYGPIRIGMTPAEASAAFGHTLHAGGSEAPERCETYHLDPGVEPQGMRLLAEEGRITRIDEHGSEGVATPQGIAVGASAEAVRAAFPQAIEEPGEHDPPTLTLTAWTEPDQRGYRFHIFDGRVTSIAVGAGAIQLTEGCS